jgi:hypothetical protein
MEQQLKVESKPFYQKPIKPEVSHASKRSKNRAEHLLRCLGKEEAKIDSLLDVGCSSAEITCEFAVALECLQTYGADIYPAS